MTDTTTNGAAATTTETAVAAPTPGTPEYDAAMAAKFDAHTNKDAPADGTTPDPDRPAWLPEKFKSAEDMAKAYAELEKKQSAPKADAPKDGEKPDADLKIEEKPADDTTQAVTNVLEQAGFKYEDIQKEYNDNGKLTDATYKGLTDKFGQGLVDDFIRGQEARAEQFRTEVLGEVGGMEGFNSMAQWAAANLPKAEIEAFNSTMDSKNTGQIKLALAGLNAKYTAANGKQPNLRQGDEPAHTTTGGYGSRAEMSRDMADPKYKSDPAFRARVQAKLAQTTAF